MIRIIAISLVSALIGGYIATHLRTKAQVNPILSLPRQCWSSDGVYEAFRNDCGDALDSIIQIDNGQ